nr:chemotaxis protein CheV [candidate division Zixibacteria bacterium]
MADSLFLKETTSEMKLLIFRLGKTPYGINVDKVREIIPRTKTTVIPHAPRAVEGSFMLREEVLTLINLGEYLEIEGDATSHGEGAIIIVQFNKVRCGILVDSVEVIHTLKWDQIEPPSIYLTDLGAPLTGITKVNEQTVLIADFESIIGRILGTYGDDAEDDIQPQAITPRDIHILLADDSGVLRKSMVKFLHRHGYNKLTVCSDGLEAWEKLQRMKMSGGNKCHAVVSDIEMPRMNGLMLTSRIKADPELKDMTVVIYSSMITAENTEKGRTVGADAQVGKPDSLEMIHALENCLIQRGLLEPATDTVMT